MDYSALGLYSSRDMEEIQAAILDTMQKLEQNAKDTVWLTMHETVFERLTKLYILAKGSEEDIAEFFPHYYGEKI